MFLHIGHPRKKVTGPHGHIPVDRFKYPAYLTGMTEIFDTLDAIGLLCPLPVLKARKRLQSMPGGATLSLLADDPAAVIDVPHFCTENGHAFLGHTKDGAHLVFLIRKGG